jgi:hypothetical protein
MGRSQKGGAWFGSNNSGYGYGSYTDSSVVTETGVNSGVLQYMYYILTLLIIGLVLLVVIHYTITPIFKLRPGDKGYIGLPVSDDSKLYWKDTNKLTILKETDTPLGSTTENWSMLLDIQIDNPTANTDTPRILFTRGQMFTKPKDPFTENDTILKINPNFNLSIWLDRLTNDMYVSTQTIETMNNSQIPYPESVVIQNVPVGKAVRVGVMLGSRVLEVYINGYLAQSKTFTKPVRASNGPLQPPLDYILSRTARVRNLRVWSRPLAPSEFRAYGGAESMDVKSLPDSCAS